MEHPDLKWALDLLVRQDAAYRLFRDYYEGRQHLAFSTKKFDEAFGALFRALAYNRCSGVIDAHADKLIVTGWTIDQADSGWSDAQRAELEAHAGQIWDRNRMTIGARQVHIEELTLGDGYVIVWPDIDGQPKIAPQDGDRCVVRYSDVVPGTVDLGVKVWRIRDGRWRVNAYYADHYERFVTRKATTELPANPRSLDPFEEDGLAAEISYDWDPGQVPLIHFGNNARIGHFGRSELHDVVRLQDGLNKTLADMLITGEAHSYPQRYAIGLIPDRDAQGNDKLPFEPDATKVWWSAVPDAKFGQFDTADLRQFVEVLDSWDLKIARVSKVPVHHLGVSRDFPSGEALRTAEAPFTAKIRHLQATLGDAWAHVMGLALRIAGHRETGVVISPTWQNPEPRSEQEFWAEALLKINAGVPKEHIWAEAGYTVDQIAEFKRMKAEAMADMQANMNAGLFGLGNESGS